MTLGSMCKEILLMDTIVKRMRGNFIIEMYNILRSVIEYKRNVDKNPRIYDEFEHMVKSIK